MFKLIIETENAVFERDVDHEVARILRDVANRLEQGDFSPEGLFLRDINGNKVGVAEFVAK